jgi:putative transcription factor
MSYISSNDPLWDQMTIIKKKHVNKESVTKAKREGNTTTKDKTKNLDVIHKNIKLDQSNEVDKHKKISIEQSRLISKTRLEKKMTQVQLANLINEKKEIINKYECGQAIIDPKIINKINRALKINIKKKT